MRQIFLNKKFILKILITSFLIGLTVLSFVLSNYISKKYQKEELNVIDNNVDTNIIDNNESNSVVINDGLVSVSMKLIDKNGNVIFDETLRENKDEILYDVLVKHHEVRAEKSTYGMVLFDIDSVKTKFYTESYISILVNGKYSSYGVSGIYVYDGIKITFKEVALWQ